MTNILSISRARRLERLEAKPPSDDYLGLGKSIFEMTPAEHIAALKELRARYGEDVPFTSWLSTLTVSEKVDVLVELRKIIRADDLTPWGKENAAQALFERFGFTRKD